MKFVNEAAGDRFVRVALGIALLYLGWSGPIEGAMGTFLKIIGLVPLATGLPRWWPVYAILGLRTNTGSREKLMAS